MTATAQTEAFLSWAHERAVDCHLEGVLVVAVPIGNERWRSRCFPIDRLDEAAAHAVDRSNAGENVYTRVHLLDAAVPSYRRGTSKQTRWITYLAADVDIAGPGHKPPEGKDLPPTLDAALELIDATLAPSSVIASGGGLYPCYRFDEPLDLAVDDGLAATVRTIGKRLDLALASHGWHVDRTALDLSRVHRPAGVVNHKPGRDPRPVTMLRIDRTVADYSVADLDAMLPKLPEPTPVRSSEPRADTFGRAPWEIFAERYDVDTVLAADPDRQWERVRDQNGWPAWRYIGSSAAYSIKQSPTTGAVVVWSGTIAAVLDLDPGDAVDLWGLACGLAKRDAREAARWRP